MDMLTKERLYSIVYANKQPIMIYNTLTEIISGITRDNAFVSKFLKLVQ